MSKIFLITFSLLLFMINGCATSMLHHKINEPTEKTYPTVVKNHFLFLKIENAELNISDNPNTLYLCVNASINTNTDDNNIVINKYFLSIPISSNNINNNIFVENYTIGCDYKFNSSVDNISVNLSDISIEAYVPSPKSNNAARFNLDKIYMTGEAGTLLASNHEFPTTVLQYKINNPLAGGISNYNIRVNIKNTIIPIEEKPTEFTSRDLLAVFYPFTIVWDIITTPFIYLYLAIKNIH